MERYIPERDGAYYCIRICFFLGDVVLNHRVYSKAKVIKGSRVAYSEPVEVPAGIHAKRSEMGFDYGKFDYVIHEGEVHILDANKTPGTLGEQAVNVSVAEKLAVGIQAYGL